MHFPFAGVLPSAMLSLYIGITAEYVGLLDEQHMAAVLSLVAGPGEPP